MRCGTTEKKEPFRTSVPQNQCRGQPSPDGDVLATLQTKTKHKENAKPKTPFRLGTQRRFITLICTPPPRKKKRNWAHDPRGPPSPAGTGVPARALHRCHLGTLCLYPVRGARTHAHFLGVLVDFKLRRLSTLVPSLPRVSSSGCLFWVLRCCFTSKKGFR